MKQLPVAYNRRPMMALLVAAHNEELVLENTLQSAINAGMAAENIYVVDDNSVDKTSAIAKTVLPKENVIRVRRSGKGVALAKANKRFALSERYRWIHIADADCAFKANYFFTLRREVRVKYAAATGYVRSLPGGHPGQFRVFEYTIGMEIHRRFQALLGVVPVIPGPTSCFRADTFAKVDFANHTLTEDFDVTLQIHRLKLGRIQFIPQAVVYTQDPQTLSDYTKQITRWNRGNLQSMRRHHIGLRAQGIDAYLTFQILQNLLFFVNYCVWVPFLAASRQSTEVIATTIVFDVALYFVLTLATALRAWRLDILSAFPIIYAYRWIGLAIFLKAFVEVVVLQKFRHTKGSWDNGAHRRYKIKTA